MAGRPLLYLSSAAASLGDALLGYSLGITAVFQVQPSFIHRIYGVQVTALQIEEQTTGVNPLLPAMIIACYSVTALLASLGSAYTLDFLGRRLSIRIGAVLYFITSCIQMIAPDFATLIAGRAIQGIGAGILSTSTPVYQVEIAPADARGVLAGVEALCMNAGYAASTWVGYAFFAHAKGEHSWRGPYGVQAAVSLILLLFTFILPESPRWLVQNGFKTEGLWTLADLHAAGDVTDESVNHTYYGIVDTLALEGEGRTPRWTDLVRDYPRRTLIGLLARTLAQLNGISALLDFLPERLAQAGFHTTEALFYAGCCTLPYTLGPLPAILFVERVGRRRFLLAGSAALALTLALVGVLQLYVDHWPHMLAHLGGPLGVFVATSAYFFVFGATWGPVPWLLSAELFPFRMRARGMALTTAADWLAEGLSGLVAGPLVHALGGGYYFLLAGACGVSGLVVWGVFVETGDQPLEAIGGVFGDAQPPPRRIEQEDAVLKVSGGMRGGAGVALGAGTAVGMGTGAAAAASQATLQTAHLGASKVTLQPAGASSASTSQLTLQIAAGRKGSDTSADTVVGTDADAGMDKDKDA
ncbi:general substrate transporter [Mycena rosella]|uniref:General substrate transporter n=1 Tax=Mycena rosella TaxID=1033263 RepID=A0AAD7GJL5_MYCRO|nr:general substrate transporter [Mycena rosella]